MKCLKPGGRAIHTSEFCIFPYAKIETGGTIYYNYDSLPALIRELTEAGYHVEIDMDFGGLPMDYWIDVPPYSEFHLKLNAGGLVATSVSFIIDKPDHGL